jgi:hypothetical protein
MTSAITTRSGKGISDGVIPLGAGITRPLPRLAGP